MPPGDYAAALDDAMLLDALFDFGDLLSLEHYCGLPGAGPGFGSSTTATAAFEAAWPEAGPFPALLAAQLGDGELSSPLAQTAAHSVKDESALFAACAATAAAAAAAHLSRRAVHMKLPQHAHVAAPVGAPAGAGPYRHQEVLAVALPLLPLPGALSHLFAYADDVEEAALAALAATIRPGCTLVTMEAMVPPSRGKQPQPRAAELLRRALTTPGPAGDFLRAQNEVLVADGCGGEATWRRSDGVTEQRDVALASRVPPVHPLAVLCTRDAELSVAVAAEEEQGMAELRCRLAAGRVLPLLPLPPAAASLGDAHAAHFTLPRCDEDGVALIEAVPAGMPLHRAGAPRPVLLTSDVAIVSEVAAAGDALRTLPFAGGGGDAARAHVELVVLALGAALAPGATPAAVAAGATAALWMGWSAALAALLRTPAFVEGGAGCDTRLLSLFGHALASPRLVMMRVLLAASPMLRHGCVLAAALAAEARQKGHCLAPLVAAAALDALVAHHGAAADATAEAREAAGALLRVTAAELGSALARCNATADSETDVDANSCSRNGDLCCENTETGAVNVAIAPAEAQALVAVVYIDVHADVHAFRSTALLILLGWLGCVMMRFLAPPLPAQAVLAALPCPEWHIWLRMPTALCCNGASGPVVAVREAVITATLLLAFAPGACARRLRAAHVAALHVAVLVYFILVEPALCALATHALFGVAIRQPSQGGVKKLTITLVTHLSAEQRLPRAAHAALMLLSGALPLVVRAAQAQGPLAPPPLRMVAQLGLLPANVGWDVLHVALVLACVAHATATHRRRVAVSKIKME